MSVETFSITMTEEQFNNLVSEMKKKGMTEESLTSGVLPEMDHVVLSYVVTPQLPNIYIALTVVKKPFFVSLGEIEAHIHSMLN